MGGGRYDGLSEMLGGPKVAGVGWAAGIERLALMVKSEYVSKPDVVLIGLSENINYLLLTMMNQLIKEGLKVEIIYTGNISKKFKRAHKIKASYALVLGEDEVAKQIIKLKNLSSGHEELMSLSKATKIMKKN